MNFEPLSELPFGITERTGAGSTSTDNHDISEESCCNLDLLSVRRNHRQTLLPYRTDESGSYSTGPFRSLSVLYESNIVRYSRTKATLGCPVEKRLLLLKSQT